MPQWNSNKTEKWSDQKTKYFNGINTMMNVKFVPKVIASIIRSIHWQMKQNTQPRNISPHLCSADILIFFQIA